MEKYEEMNFFEAPSRRLLVLDDDPTGSQCVSSVEVAFDTDPSIPAEVLQDRGSTCFVLTNSRALDEDTAVEINRTMVGSVVERLEDCRGLHVVSRSDSTLRGHVIAEPNAIANALSEHSIEVDGFLFCPAMIEAGRFTKNDVHFAIVDGKAQQVEDTDFANDATFGYSHSNLADFLEERSGGIVRAKECFSISLTDIRDGGVETVKAKLVEAKNRRWIIVNATEYSDMDIVSEAVAELEEQGKVFVTRCGPSFVRSLAGQRDAQLITSDTLEIDPSRTAHGLVVVGSHVGLTSQQLTVLQQRSNLNEFELQVPKLLDSGTREQHIDEISMRVREALASSDCVLYTSRELIRTESKTESLAIARQVSDAVVAVVQASREARPAWIVAKGGITSHEVAASGLGIQRAKVQGQFYEGQISLFTATKAPEDVIGVPYVVFPGNVGGKEALAEVVERLRAATTDA